MCAVVSQADTLRSAKESAEASVVELETTYRQRVLYLEVWKHGAGQCLCIVPLLLYAALSCTALPASVCRVDDALLMLRGRGASEAHVGLHLPAHACGCVCGRRCRRCRVEAEEPVRRVIARVVVIGRPSLRPFVSSRVSHTIRAAACLCYPMCPCASLQHF
jgi:hypothetical protein